MTVDARRRSALADLRAQLGGIGAREIPFLSQASLRAVESDARSLAVPTDPNTWLRNDAREVLWLGPDEWLVVSEVVPAAEIVRAFEKRLAGSVGSAVDVSANRAVFELGAPDRQERLAATCGLDLHPRAWRSGMCAQTLLANVQVLLQERDSATRVFVRPSFAGHVVAVLALDRATG